jgi:hypothetical protein
MTGGYLVPEKMGKKLIHICNRSQYVNSGLMIRYNRRFKWQLRFKRFTDKLHFGVIND